MIYEPSKILSYGKTMEGKTVIDQVKDGYGEMYV